MSFKNCLSNPTQLNIGVPQGSILGPLLFAVYINDLPLYINTTCDLFADDCTIYTSQENRSELENSLQKELDNLTRWSNENRMQINIDKTKSMLITTRQKLQTLAINGSPLELRMGTLPIVNVNEHKTLVLLIDSHFSWSSHVHVLTKKIAPKRLPTC